MTDNLGNIQVQNVKTYVASSRWLIADNVWSPVLVEPVTYELIVDCSVNAGGWPLIAENTKFLVTPANPNQLAVNGHTNLENWLDQYSQAVTDQSGQPDLDSDGIPN